MADSKGNKGVIIAVSASVLAVAITIWLLSRKSKKITELSNQAQTPVVDNSAVILGQQPPTLATPPYIPSGISGGGGANLNSELGINYNYTDEDSQMHSLDWTRGGMPHTEMA